MIWGLAIVGVLVIYLIGAAVIPRWWARRIGNVVDGRLSTGAAAGVFFGVLFTILPLLLLWAAWRFRRRTLALWFVVLAIVLAIPNLMTLAIVLGGGTRPTPANGSSTSTGPASAAAA